MSLSNFRLRLPNSSLGPQYYPRLLVLFLAAFFSVLATAYGWTAIVKEKQDEARLKQRLMPGLQVDTNDIFVTTLISSTILILVSFYALVCLLLSLLPRTKDLSTHSIRVQVVFLTLGVLCLIGTMVPYMIIFQTHHIGVMVSHDTSGNGKGGLDDHVDRLLTAVGANPDADASAGGDVPISLNGQIVGLPSTSIFTSLFNSNITSNSTEATSSSSAPSNFLKEYRDIAYLLHFAILPWIAIFSHLLAAGVLFYQTWDKDVDESELRGLGFDFNSDRSSNASFGGFSGATKSVSSQRPLMVERAMRVGFKKTNVSGGSGRV